MSYTTKGTWVELNSIPIASCADEGNAKHLAAMLNECGKEPTLRDRFAMAALTGMLANMNKSVGFDNCGEACYKVADAMLAARGGAS